MVKVKRIVLFSLSIIALFLFFYPKEQNTEIEFKVYDNVAKIQGNVIDVKESSDSTKVIFDNGSNIEFNGVSPVPIFHKKCTIWYDKNSKVIIGVE